MQRHKQRYKQLVKICGIPWWPLSPLKVKAIQCCWKSPECFIRTCKQRFLSTLCDICPLRSKKTTNSNAVTQEEREWKHLCHPTRWFTEASNIWHARILLRYISAPVVFLPWGEIGGLTLNILVGETPFLFPPPPEINKRKLTKAVYTTDSLLCTLLFFSAKGRRHHEFRTGKRLKEHIVLLV